jgi:hypothetical protein
MKKFLAVLAVLAITVTGVTAFAADVTLGGSVELRSRMFDDLDLNSKADDSTRTTEQRMRLDINAKTDNTKAKITIENDWDLWGRLETAQANEQATNVNNVTTGKTARLNIREAWVDFKLPGTPVNIKAGHQLLSVGNGWFFRAMKFGSDAWLITSASASNLVGFVNIKVDERDTVKSDDKDAYVLFDSYKLSDTHTVGVDFTRVITRDYLDTTGASTGKNNTLDNLGVNYTGKLGPVALKAEVDVQMGSKEGAAGAADKDYKGNQVVLQASIPMDALTFNATLASGSGQDTSTDTTLFQTILDKDPHYTVVYEYLLKTAAGAKNTGFANTMAVNVGAGYKISDSLSASLDLWLLQANEDVALGAATKKSSDLGTEVDVRINWKLYDNLTWNWVVGYFMPGDAYKLTDTTDADAATAIQGVLGMKF